MPDRPLTVLTYAASASLAAVALVYFFSPNYLIDGDSSASSASTRKKGIVGLFNPANDCFINSVLQSLAGLGHLRLYLIRELHRRDLGGSEIYEVVPLVDSNGKEVDGRKQASMQSGEVTRGLKIMIDKLNERPIYKKTISAAAFIRVLESAFGTRISKSQQDAQELLQVVAERLSEEYHAGREARRRAGKAKQVHGSEPDVVRQEVCSSATMAEEVSEDLDFRTERPTTSAPTNLEPARDDEIDPLDEEEEGFPLEGQTEARTECQHCQFVPKVSPTSFVMLNLMVPQKSSTTLNECIDAHFKREYIDDYKCDKCRLEHAVEMFSNDLRHAKSDEQKAIIESSIAKVRSALNDDPEKAPAGVDLPDTKYAPKRKIARHIEITSFPRVLVIHLSRSLYDLRSSSTKNLAKVSFPEKFPLGGLLNRRNYKLLGMVTHKGTHNSGHYETFRRQHLYAPISTPHVDSTTGPYSASGTPAQPIPKPQSPKTSQGNSPSIPVPSIIDSTSPSTHSHSPSSSSNSKSLPSTRPSSGDMPETPRTSKLSNELSSEPLKSEDARLKHNSKSASLIDVSRLKRRKRPVDRWWRISDDKVKECKTSDVLCMQKEVYMLFYEMDNNEGDGG